MAENVADEQIAALKAALAAETNRANVAEAALDDVRVELAAALLYTSKARKPTRHKFEGGTCSPPGVLSLMSAEDIHIATLMCDVRSGMGLSRTFLLCVCRGMGAVAQNLDRKAPCLNAWSFHYDESRPSESRELPMISSSPDRSIAGCGWAGEMDVALSSALFFSAPFVCDDSLAVGCRVGTIPTRPKLCAT
jgi:hypothetical protein